MRGTSRGLISKNLGPTEVPVPTAWAQGAEVTGCDILNLGISG